MPNDLDYTGPVPAAGGRDDGLTSRERTFVLGGLTGIAIAIWTKLIILSWLMPMVAPDHVGIDLGNSSGLALEPGFAQPILPFRLLLGMILLEVAAIMLPAVTPVLLHQAALMKRQEPGAEVLPRGMAFILGYLGVWLLAGLGLNLMVWLGQAGGLFGADGALVTPISGGLLLLVVGFYQMTPAKLDSLDRCQVPQEMLLRWHRPGLAGALRAGGMHGLASMVCSGVLLLALLIGGAANLSLVLAVALLVWTERLVPLGGGFSRWAGTAIGLVGIAMLLGTLLGSL